MHTFHRVIGCLLAKMSLRRIRLAKRLKSFKRLRLIPRFCDFGISSTFDAVLRYLPIFLRYYGNCRYFLRYCDVRHPPMSPSTCAAVERSMSLVLARLLAPNALSGFASKGQPFIREVQFKT